jgi:hypothetical protein
MRLAAALPVALALGAVACRAPDDARRSGQVRYEGRTLEEWWRLRRDANDEIAQDARTAIRRMGGAAVPFLAAKAAAATLGDNIGGSVALEDLCPAALPALEAARAARPSPALEVAIRSVRADSARRAATADCAAAGAPSDEAPSDEAPSDGRRPPGAVRRGAVRRGAVRGGRAPARGALTPAGPAAPPRRRSAMPPVPTAAVTFRPQRPPTP